MQKPQAPMEVLSNCFLPRQTSKLRHFLIVDLPWNNTTNQKTHANQLILDKFCRFNQIDLQGLRSTRNLKSIELLDFYLSLTKDVNQVISSRPSVCMLLEVNVCACNCYGMKLRVAYPIFKPTSVISLYVAQNKALNQTCLATKIFQNGWSESLIFWGSPMGQSISQSLNCKSENVRQKTLTWAVFLQKWVAVIQKCVTISEWETTLLFRP